MSKRSVADLMVIAEHGGGFELDASDYTPEELMTIARKLCDGATMRLRRVERWSTDDLAQIAQHAPPGVVQYLFGG